MPSHYETTHEKDRTYFLINCAQKELSCESHFHSNIEVIYVLDGHATAIINKRKYELKKDYICLILSYEEHEFIVDNYCNCFSLSVPEFLVGSFLGLVNKKSLFSNVMIPNEYSTIIESCFRNLLLPNHPLASKGYIYTILGNILGSISLVDTVVSTQGKNIVMKAIEYINSNFQNDITMKELASEVGYSINLLSTLFNEVVGCGFREYLNSIRINHANYLFSQGERNILNAALNSGFNSIRTFNRAYKNTVGLSPRQYINNRLASNSRIRVGDYIIIANMNVYVKKDMPNGISKEKVLWHWTNRMPSAKNVSHEIVNVEEEITGVPIGIKTTFLNTMSYDASFYQDDNHDKAIDLTDVFEDTYLSFFVKSSDGLENIDLKMLCGNASWTSFMSKIFTIKKCNEWQKVTIKLSEMLSATAFEKEKFIFTWLQPAEISLSSSLIIK